MCLSLLYSDEYSSSYFEESDNLLDVSSFVALVISKDIFARFFLVFIFVEV
jgi:hypothetical protein